MQKQLMKVEWFKYRQGYVWLYDYGHKHWYSLQWLWHSWHGSRFPIQRTQVRNQSSASSMEQLSSVNFRKDKNNFKETGLLKILVFTMLEISQIIWNRCKSLTVSLTECLVNDKSTCDIFEAIATLPTACYCNKSNLPFWKFTLFVCATKRCGFL